MNGASCACPGLREHLRQVTGPAHRALEARLDILRTPLRRDRFIALLQSFLAFHRRWEPAVMHALPNDTHFLQARLRCAGIEADLRALGAPPEASPVSADNAQTIQALCQDEGHAIGSLYVIEGSALGGRMISDRLAGAPWITVGRLHTFDPYGNSLAARWRETLARVERLPHAQWVAAVRGALQTFECLRSHLPAAEPAAGAPNPSSGTFAA